MRAELEREILGESHCAGGDRREHGGDEEEGERRGDSRSAFVKEWVTSVDQWHPVLLWTRWEVV